MQFEICVQVTRERFQYEDYTGDYDVFALVESGSFRFRRDGGWETVSAGEGVCFEKGVRYLREVISPASIFLFRFRSDVPIFPAEKIAFRDTGRIRSTIQFLQELREHPRADAFQFQSSLFADIVNQYRMENALTDRAKRQQDDAIAEGMHMIQRDCGTSLRLPDVAAAVHLSYVQFSRRFKAVAGMTPFEYVAALRMEKARQLLADTDLPLRFIAAECGFENEYYFSSFFKKHCRMSPTAFRGSLL